MCKWLKRVESYDVTNIEMFSTEAYDISDLYWQDMQLDTKLEISKKTNNQTIKVFL